MHHVRLPTSEDVWAGLLHFDAYSDAVIVRGLIALLLQVYSGHPAAEILATPPDFIDRLGLSKHLSMNRANGLNAMIRRIKACAEAAIKRDSPVVH